MQKSEQGSQSVDWRKRDQTSGTKPARPERAPTRTKIKKSYGIACCRFNKKNRPEILLVCKRYTYSYSIFVHGNYNSGSDSQLVQLFNGMTNDEKNDILSLNFIQIWYRIWSTTKPCLSSFFMAKNKFDTTFLIDSGVRLRRLIAQSTQTDRIWEIPKGRKKYKSEPNNHCAIREFAEETGVTKKHYKIFPESTRACSYVDGNVRYKNVYYLALANHNIIPQVNFARPEQAEEVADIKWMTIEHIRLIDSSGRLENLVRPMFNFMKKYTKKH